MKTGRRGWRGKLKKSQSREVGVTNGKKIDIVCPIKLTETITPKNKGRGKKLCNDQKGIIHGAFQRDREPPCFL